MILQIIITHRLLDSQKLILTKKYDKEFKSFNQFIENLNDEILKLQINKEYIVTYGAFYGDNLATVSVSINDDGSYNILEQYIDEDPNYGEPFYVDINNEITIDKDRAIKSVTILDDSNFIEQYIDMIK